MRQEKLCIVQFSISDQRKLTNLSAEVIFYSPASPKISKSPGPLCKEH